MAKKYFTTLSNIEFGHKNRGQMYSQQQQNSNVLVIFAIARFDKWIACFVAETSYTWVTHWKFDDLWRYLVSFRYHWQILGGRKMNDLITDWLSFRRLSRMIFIANYLQSEFYVSVERSHFKLEHPFSAFVPLCFFVYKKIELFLIGKL